MTIPLWIHNEVDGVFTDFDSLPTLSDPTATYGVKRTDTDAVVVNAGTAFTRASAGKYYYLLTPPADGLTYQWSAQFTYLGLTDWANKFSLPPATSSIPDPPTGNSVTGYMYTRTNGDVLAPGTIIYWRMIQAPDDAGDAYPRPVTSTASDVSTALWSAPLRKGAKYELSLDQNHWKQYDIASDATSPLALPDLL